MWASGARIQVAGLGEWIRVRDYREQQILRMPNVEIYRESTLTAQDILDVGADQIAVATGARWRADGFGRSSLSPITLQSATVKISWDTGMRSHAGAWERGVSAPTRLPSQRVHAGAPTGLAVAT